MRYFFILLLVIFPVHAGACIVEVPFEKEDVEEARAIFSGEVVDYEWLENEFAMAKITFKVNRAYRGNLDQTIKVIWQNSTYSVPETLAIFKQRYGENLIVGLLNSDEHLPLRGPSSTYKGYKDQDLAKLPKILQAPCASPFMFSEEGLHELGIDLNSLK